MRKLLIYLGSIASVSAIAVVALEVKYDRQVESAKAYCEAVARHLESAKDSDGIYPDALDPKGLPASRPELVQASDFYLSSPDGKSYLLRFKDPRLDPRFWFNDVYGYDSEEGFWRQYDGY